MPLKTTKQILSFDSTSVQELLPQGFRHHFVVKTDGVWKGVFRIREVQERILVLPYPPRTQQQVLEKGKGWVTASFPLGHYCNCLREHLRRGSSRWLPLDTWIGPESASVGKPERVIPHYCKFSTRLDV